MHKEAIEKQILLLLKDEVIKLRIRNADNEKNIKALMRYYNKIYDSLDDLKKKNGIVADFPSSSTTFFNPLISNDVIIKKDTKKKKVKKCFCCCF